MRLFIDGTEYDGDASVSEKRIEVSITADISSAFEWNKEMTVEIGGVGYPVSKIVMLIQSNSLLQVAWERISNFVVLEEQFEEAQLKLQESYSRLDLIRTAIGNLDGIPTLSKLVSFLSAIKEIIHYDE